MPHKPRVYLSSTYVDLEAHRSALKVALERAGYDVECMEKYPAFNARPLDKCLADVAAADIFLLVLAHHYGSRPKEGNPERRSITHLEYEEAARLGKPCLVFLVEEEYPWNPKWIDWEDDARDLKTLRSTVASDHGVRRFTDPAALVNQVLQALSEPKSPIPLATQNLTRLSNDDLRKLVADLTHDMRTFEASANAGLFADSPDGKNGFVDRVIERGEQRRKSYRIGLLPRVQAIHQELLDRLGIAKPTYVEGVMKYEMAAIYGALVGPAPITEAAGYLESLVRRLP